VLQRSLCGMQHFVAPSLSSTPLIIERAVVLPFHARDGVDFSLSYRPRNSCRINSHEIAAHLFPSKCGCGENRFALGQKNRASSVKRLRSSGGRLGDRGPVFSPEALGVPSLGNSGPDGKRTRLGSS
jgi:hypothetical protein